jgi:hypothetical protein
MIENYFLELLIYFLLLTKDHITLSLYCLGLKFGVLENVGEYVDRGGDVRIKRFGIVDSIFAL